MSEAVALIVAAGRGTRAGADIPKQFRPLAGEAMLRRTCCAFLAHPGIAAVHVVIHPDDRGLYYEAIGDLALPTPMPGGATRQDSSRNGLEALAAGNAPDVVLIHDGARPLVDQDTISRVLAALATGPAAIAAVPVIDTLKRAGDDNIATGTVDRTGLWRAQTPQGFHFPAILAAHRALAGQSLTDDAAVAEAAGMPVKLVPGQEDNVKITTEADFTRAERQLAAGDIRVGTGFDVHRFAPGDHVKLCGIKIPHEQGLSGHSDADVGLHAITDSVFGALGEGDIGSHFPPSGLRWRAANSAMFLMHAVSLVTTRGGEIRHLDVTLICEQPKIGPHRQAMRERVAKIANLPIDRISIKATTTEGLGFTGRGEGIAAQAVATVRL